MDESGDWVKQRTIVLKESNIGDVEAALSRLSAMHGIISLGHDGLALAVKYDLRKISLADIQSGLHSLNMLLKLALVQRLRYGLIHFMETNQRDNLQQKSGWHERVRDIYTWHYQHKADDAGIMRSQLWRKYTNKK